MRAKIFKCLLVFSSVICLIVLLFSVLHYTKKEVSSSKGAEKLYDTPMNFSKEDTGILILCYHRVLNENQLVKLGKTISSNSQLHSFNVEANKFKEEMNFLKKNQIPVISINEMLERIKKNQIDKKYVVITFDDIDISIVQNAFPVLNELNFPYTTFVITGQTSQYLDGSQMANWSDIEKLSFNPLVTIGLHTDDMHYQEKNKPILSKKSSYKEFVKDYKASIKHYSEHIATQAPSLFASPYGVLQDNMADYLYQQGIQAIFSLENGVVNSDSDLKRLPRVIVTDQSWKYLSTWLLRK